jgi:integrase
LRPGSTTSPSTVKKDLRNLKVAANRWHKWKRLEEVPDFGLDSVRVPVELQRHVTEEHFNAMLKHAGAATRPVDLPRGETADWWRALLTFCVTTGWRIHSEVCQLKVRDLDLETGEIITWASDNKASRSERDHLDPYTLALVGRIVSAKNRYVFDFPSKRILYDEFALIQDAAGLGLPCIRSQKHDCTACCHRYGFHDFRRSCATFNLDILTGEELRQKMRHSSYSTTQKYITYAAKSKETAEKVYVPAAAKRAASA